MMGADSVEVLTPREAAAEGFVAPTEEDLPPPDFDAPSAAGPDGPPDVPSDASPEPPPGPPPPRRIIIETDGDTVRVVLAEVAGNIEMAGILKMLLAQYGLGPRQNI